MLRLKKLKERIFIVTAFSVILNLALCHGKAMIWMRHSGIEDLFLRLHDTNSFSSVKSLTELAKTELCNSDITLFSPLGKTRPTTPSTPSHSSSSSRLDVSNETPPVPSPSEDFIISYRVLHPYLFDGDQNNYSYTYNPLGPKQNPPKIEIFVKNIIVRVDALPCISFREHRWYIINGYNQDIYFTAESTSEEGNFSLTGILEPFPYLRTYKRDIESEFLKGQRWTARLRKRTNLCKLDTLHRFRLCNAMHAALGNHKRTMMRIHRWFMTMDSSEVVCVEDAPISLKQSPESLIALSVDLLACEYLSKDLNPSTFLITADELNFDSVFLVQKKETNWGIEYTLIAHARGLAMLTSDLRLELLVDIEGESDDSNFGNFGFM